MANLADLVLLFRRQLLERDAKAAARLVRAYGLAYQRIQRELSGITGKLEAARNAGETVRPFWLYQQDRLTGIKRTAEREIGRFSELARQEITTGQHGAVTLAAQHATDLLETALPPGPETARAAVNFVTLPTEALSDLVGRLGDGSPLRAVFDSLGPEAAAALERALIEGIALGQNPEAIARSVREDLGGQLTRALTISRTEVLRTYREASQRSYQANSDTVKGWVWVCDPGENTCAACWAMQGTFHELDEPLDSHPRCRCVMEPVTKSWAEMGIEGVPDTRPETPDGEALFAKQSEAVQLSVLGKAGFAAWRSGEVTLRDFVGQKSSDAWGTMRYQRSLKGAMAAHATGEGEADWAAPGVASPRMQAHAERAVIDARNQQ